MIRTKRRSLVEARIRAGLGQRALARRLELSSGYLSQIERGERNPSPELAKRLHELLGVEFDDLFEILSEEAI